ncbi:VOC family protein [Actinoplanes sp. NPDC023801]|uniref:VOC family protein n=1 Tax=Actinoplanes sp. NPDC023801 TaxID=3154595 RepID=UPI0033F4FDDE
MHRSRLFGLFIDTPSAETPAAATFWAGAFGTTATPVPGEEEFIALRDAFPGLAVDVQSVDDAPRYHLDIETDDVPAETARLLALGATVVADHGGHKTLRAPGGHLLCVVPVQSDQRLFETTARTWTTID